MSTTSTLGAYDTSRGHPPLLCPATTLVPGSVTTGKYRHPCDLSHGPLLRTYLLRLNHDEHVLLLTLHHIITDDWSNNVLRRELVTLYQAHVSGRQSPVGNVWSSREQAPTLQVPDHRPDRACPCPPPLPIQYADYAIFQRKWLQGEILEAQRLDLFKASTIATLVARFEALLQNSVNEPDLPIDLLRLSPDAARVQREPEQQESKQRLPIPDDGWFDLPRIDFTQDS